MFRLTLLIMKVILLFNLIINIVQLRKFSRIKVQYVKHTSFDRE